MEQIESLGKMVLASDTNSMEKMFFGLKITVMGLGTVFAVLIFLWLVLSFFQLVLDKKPSVNANTITVPAAPINIPAPQVSVSDEDDMELIAILTAAICAATGASDASKLRIVSYKRQKTPWNRK